LLFGLYDENLMNIHPLHRWNLSPTEAIALQRELAGGVIRTGTIDPSSVRLIAGTDVSSSKDSPLLTAGVVVWDRTTGSIVASSSAQVPETFPYIPGLLSFREIPALLSAIERLEVIPDVWMVDGQGIAHPRRLGIAAHLGLFLDAPTIGVAKHILCGKAEDPGVSKGSIAPLIHQDEEIGALVRTRDSVSPVIVSLGHRIDLPSSIALVLDAARGYRLPEPTRLAHVYVNDVRRTGMP
jgi:deoxyribonuclease V